MVGERALRPSRLGYGRSRNHPCYYGCHRIHTDAPSPLRRKQAKMSAAKRVDEESLRCNQAAGLRFREKSPKFFLSDAWFPCWAHKSAKSKLDTVSPTTGLTIG